MRKNRAPELARCCYVVRSCHGQSTLQHLTSCKPSRSAHCASSLHFTAVAIVTEVTMCIELNNGDAGRDWRLISKCIIASCEPVRCIHDMQALSPRGAKIAERCQLGRLWRIGDSSGGAHAACRLKRCCHRVVAGAFGRLHVHSSNQHAAFVLSRNFRSESPANPILSRAHTRLRSHTRHRRGASRRWRGRSRVRVRCACRPLRCHRRR